MAAALSRATTASASVHARVLGAAPDPLGDRLGVKARARPALERQLLELAREPRLAGADDRDERARALQRRASARARGCLGDRPFGQVPLLDRHLGGDVAARLRDRRGAAPPAPSRGPPRARRRRPSCPRHRSQRAPARGARSTSASFQRSTPSTIRKRRPIASVSAPSSAPPPSACVGALEHLERRRLPPSCSASARSRARRSPMRPWSSPWIR